MEMVSALNIDDHLEHIEGLQQLAAGSRKQLGELLQDSGRLTSAKLDEVLSEQQRTGQRIGEIITQHKLLSDTELGVALEFQGRQSKQGTTVDKLKLGNVLIASGKITPDQLSEALALQAKEGGRLGDVLVALGYISKLEINTGLDLQSKLLGAVLSLSMMTAASSFVAGNAQASDISNFQSLSSSLPRAEMQVSHQQSRVEVTQEDVERGYVDVANASIFSVETSRGVGRYMVDLAVRGDDFSAASVEGLGLRAQLGSDGGATIMQSATTSVTTLSYRLTLNPNLKAGSYDWPIMVHARAS